jgi:hypothetical protein
MFKAKAKNKSAKPQTQDDNDVMLHVQAEKDEEFLEKVIFVYTIHCICARY